MAIIISKNPRRLLSEMTSDSVSSRMINEAKSYLLHARQSCSSAWKFVEIAAEREKWKVIEQVDLSVEDQQLDQLAFLAAAVELDVIH